MRLLLPLARRALACSVLGLAALGATEKPAPALTIFTNLTIIDGTGAPAASGMAIVVEGERIKSVLPMAALTSSPVFGAAVVDLTGKFALPGLIDTHQHLGTTPNRRAAEAQLNRMLYGGVTAVRDMAGDTRFLADLSRAARLAEIPSPEIFFSALMAGPGFFKDPRTHSSAQGADPGHVPWMQGITADTDIVTAVTLARGTGASGIKIYADLPAAEVRRIVAEAHRQGIPVWAHATIFPSSPSDGITAGIDSISHAYMLAYELNPTGSLTYHAKPAIDAQQLHADTKILPALFAEMIRHGTILDATVYTFFEAAQLSPADKNARGPVCAQVTAAAYRAGVAISAGTDFIPPADDPYPAMQLEIEALVRDVGMTPADALRSATSIGARALKADSDMGTITAGKLANLVFVSRNPLVDIKALREVVLTVKRGRPYPRSDYRQPDAKLLNEDF